MKGKRLTIRNGFRLLLSVFRLKSSSEILRSSFASMPVYDELMKGIADTLGRERNAAVVPQPA